MPDPVVIVKSLIAAAGAAAIVFLACALPWRSPSRMRASIGGVLGVAAGLSIGCYLMGLMPAWPPREDQGRWLFVLFPAVVLVEFFVSLIPHSFRPAARWAIAWALRSVLAVIAAPILLHNTVYLADLAGPGTREWSPAQAWIILAALAIALVGVWFALWVLVQRSPGRSVPLALMLACATAAVTVMLSGYASGGLAGLPLAAAIAGALAASLVVRGPLDLGGLIGLAVTGVFALVVVGMFFGELTRANAALLLFGPLCCWLPELPGLRKIRPSVRGILRVVLTAIPLIVALFLAKQKFAAETAKPTPGDQETSPEDYMNMGG